MPIKVKRASAKQDVDPHGEAAALRTLELVFFTHLQTAQEADEILAQYGLGRAHHRVMHFAAQCPGISVGDLAGLLRISAQALARTTGHLSRLGFLEQIPNAEDRRIRQNYLTKKGQQLLKTLVQRQIAFIAQAQKTMLPSDIEGMWHGLQLFCRPEDMQWVTPNPWDASDDNGL